MAEARVVKFCTLVRRATMYHLNNKLSLELEWSQLCMQNGLREPTHALFRVTIVPLAGLVYSLPVCNI